MKKIVSVVLIIAIVFCFSGCGKSEDVKMVEDLINGLLLASEVSAEKLELVETMYNSLSEKEKAKVGNYTLLETMRENYTKEAAVYGAIAEAEELIAQFDFIAAEKKLEEVFDMASTEQAGLITALLNAITEKFYDGTHFVKYESVVLCDDNNVVIRDDNKEFTMFVDSLVTDDYQYYIYSFHKGANTKFGDYPGSAFDNVIKNYRYEYEAAEWFGNIVDGGNLFGKQMVYYDDFENRLAFQISENSYSITCELVVYTNG